MRATINTFSKGMSMDSDKSVQEKNAYRSSVNGRLVFKSDGTMAWSNIKGNKVSFSISAGYDPRGVVEIDSKLIILSYNTATTYSEIGFVELDDSGLNESKITPTYNVMFNDERDPNGDKLNLTARCDIQSYAEVSEDDYLTNTGANEQNEFIIERIYWTDNINEPRSFNLGLYYYVKKATPGFDFKNTTYTAITPTGKYMQQFYSVHNMALSPDMKMGWIEHNKLETGNLLSGQYMYSYRLTTLDGKTSSWHPVTNKMSVVDAEKNNTNWNKYHMGVVGSNSGKSNELFVYIYDKRWLYFEVAYVYYSTELVAQEAKIFYNGTVDFNNTIHTIKHFDNTGTTITPVSLKQQYTPIERARTLAIKNKTLLLGNYKERNPVELSQAKLEAITVKPHFRFMRSDEKQKQLSPPITHQSTMTQYAWRSLYLDRTDTAGGAVPGGRYAKNSLSITQDYRNYKGVQVETSFSGYFRGETYRIGIVLYDKKGKPGFVQHICDITMPEIHGNASNQTEYKILRRNDTYPSTHLLNIPNTTGGILSGGGTNQPSKYTENTNVNSFPVTYTGSLNHTTTWGVHSSNFPSYMPGTGSTASVNDHWVRIMGLWIDNIDLTDVIDDISGFEIVRSKRDPKVVGRGLLLSTCYLLDGSTITDKTFPTPIIENTNHNTGAAGYSDTFGYYVQSDNMIGGGTRISDGTKFMNYRPKTFQFLSPDLMISNDYNISGNDKIRLEGSLLLSWRASNAQQREELVGANDHFMVKLYDSYGPSTNSFYTDWDGSSYVTTNYLETDILKSFTKLGSGNAGASYDPSNTDFVYHNQYPGDTTQAISMHRGDNTGQAVSYFSGPFANSHQSMAYGTNDNVLLVLDTWNRVVPNFSQSNTDNYIITPPLVSLYRDGGGTYGGVDNNGLATSSYESIGEFTAVDEDVKAKILTSGSYIMDGRETWGGDCYLDIFDLAYLMPWYQYGADCGSPEKTTNSGNDYYWDFAQGIMFPIESKYNFMLHRTEQGFGGVGTKSQYETEEGENRGGVEKFNDGFRVSESSCHSPVTEQFTDSGLGHFDNSEYSHAVKPILYKQLVTFPYSWIWSTSKSHGETYDNFSRFPVANKLDLEGKHGQITSNGTIGDMLVSFQETAFGKLPVKDRAVLSSGDSSLIIGDASFMNRIDYASTNVGNKDQFSLTSSGSHLFWTDITNGKLYQFGGGGLVALNDAKGFHNYFEEILKTTYGTGANIHSGYDHKNHEVYFSILASPGKISAAAISLINKTGIYHEANTVVGSTIIYNTHLKSFTSFISAIPKMWFSFGDNFYSTRQQTGVVSSQEKVYIYNENDEGSFFETLNDSKINVIVNDIAQYSKVFDNIVMNINNDGYGLLKTINIATDDQTQTLNVLTDTRAKYREQFFRLPLRGLNQTQRVRGKWAELEFVFKNESDKEIVFTDLETKYRISRKI